MAENDGNDPQPVVPDGFKLVPKDGSWIPRDRLNDVLSEVKDLRRLTEAQNVPEPKAIVSRQAALDMVENGEMTQAEADELFRSQITTDVAQTLAGELETRDLESTHRALLNQYQDAIPDLKDETSALYNTVLKEYGTMVQSWNLPPTTGTMLASIKAVVGPIAHVKTKGVREVEDFQDRNSGQISESETKTSKLSEKQQGYYTQMIQSGYYKDWDEVHKLLDK